MEITVSGTETTSKGTRVTPPASDGSPAAHCPELCSLPAPQAWPRLYSGRLSETPWGVLSVWPPCLKPVLAIESYSSLTQGTWCHRWEGPGEHAGKGLRLEFWVGPFLSVRALKSHFTTLSLGIHTHGMGVLVVLRASDYGMDLGCGKTV